MRQAIEAAIGGGEGAVDRVGEIPLLAVVLAAVPVDAVVFGGLGIGLAHADALAAAKGVMVSIGPVLVTDHVDAEVPGWAAELTRTTKNLSFSIVVASPDMGVHHQAAAIAAQTMIAVANVTADGVANFRFAAAANIAPGTPFFPVAYHQGPDAVAVGLESANVVQEALAAAANGLASGNRAGSGKQGWRKGWSEC